MEFFNSSGHFISRDDSQISSTYYLEFLAHASGEVDCFLLQVLDGDDLVAVGADECEHLSQLVVGVRADGGGAAVEDAVAQQLRQATHKHTRRCNADRQVLLQRPLN